MLSENAKAENTKRIAKNTLMLYVRMLFSMVVSLYTSRVVLNTLGVEDYGIYNVVGGIVAMIGFLNDSMSGATSRFLTFELGHGNFTRMRETFSSALIIHIGIAVVILIFGETIGLWFLENKLVIPHERMHAARVVYQISIISTMIGVTQVPYNACIISHEKMDVYAYIGILNTCLRLVIVYLLVIFEFDKLILLSVLSLLVSLTIMGIYRVYCINHYEESRFSFIWKKDLLKPMLKFSGWDLYGNASVTARTYGVNMLLNIFFGPSVNAAAGIATQVQGAVMGFAGNLVTAVRPQIVKSYAVGEYEEVFSLLTNSIKLCFLLLACLSVPIICEAEFIFDLWLGIVPEYAILFTTYILLFNFFANMSTLLASVIHATGNIWRPSMINGTLYLAVIPVSYFAYKLGYNPDVAYLFNLIAVVFGLLSNAWTIKLYVEGFSFTYFLTKVFVPCVLTLFTILILTSSIRLILPIGWIRLFVTVFISCVLIFLGGYVLLSKSYRVKLLTLIKGKICIKS